MTTLTSVLMLLQLAAALVAGVQTNPNVTEEQKAEATAFATKAIQTAFEVIRTYEVSTSTVMASPSNPVPEVIAEAPQVEAPQIVEAPVVPKYRVVDRKIFKTEQSGTCLTFRIVDKEGKDYRNTISPESRVTYMDGIRTIYNFYTNDYTYLVCHAELSVPEFEKLKLDIRVDGEEAYL